MSSTAVQRPARATDLTEQILDLRAGDHLCLVYEDNPVEQMPVLIPLIQQGLTRTSNQWGATMETFFTPPFPCRCICQYNRSRLPSETSWWRCTQSGRAHGRKCRSGVRRNSRQPVLAATVGQS